MTDGVLMPRRRSREARMLYIIKGEFFMANYDNKIDDNDKMTLYLDDGTELVCDVLGIFNGGENEYVALLPEDADEDTEIFLYRFILEDEDFENIKLENIESDEEFELASKAYEEYMNTLEMLDEDE